MIYLNPKMNTIYIIKNKRFTGLDNIKFWKLMANRRIDKIETILEKL
jgi:hypothetical protein